MSHNRQTPKGVASIAGTTFSQSLAIPEFRRLWYADTQSAIGDQLARVALSLLVYERTKSGLATAAVYALTFVPALFGGAVLSAIGDRWPRRRVLIASDVSRAILTLLMAWKATPLPVLVALLVLVVLIGSVFKPTESALVADILDPEIYASGVGVRNLTFQLAQLAGFTLGGVCVAAIGARSSLALDAATFALSALVVRFGVGYRPAPRTASADGTIETIGIIDAIRRIFAVPMLRNLLGLAWLFGFYVVPEGLAAPYAANHGDGPVAVGFLLASIPAGIAVGTVGYLRLPAAQRRNLVGPGAIAAGLPLIAVFLDPPVPVLAILLALSGVCTAYQVQVQAEFMPLVPTGLRSQAIGIASSGLLAAQGIGLLLGGIIAQVSDASVAIGACGLLGAVLVTPIAVARRRLASASSPTVSQSAQA